VSATLTTSPCPECAAPVVSDPRFTDWCPACEWNLEPEPPRSRRRERRRNRDRARVERLYAVLAARSSEQGGRHGVAWFLAVVIAALVHLWTLGVLAGSLWMLVHGFALLKVVGALGVCLAWLLRPRLGSWRADQAVLGREQAPVLYALVDRTADTLGTRRPDRIRISSSFNASYRRGGFRRRVELTLGLPLWTVLTGPQRIALLGHELGHGSNGDVRRGFWLGTALSTLDAWYRLLTPRAGDAFVMRRRSSAATDILATVLLRWCALPVRLLHGVLFQLTMRSSQRAEYRADELAARAGSSAETAAMLGTLLLSDTVTTRVAQQRAAHGNRRIAKGSDPIEEFWTGLTDYVHSVPQSERDRRARLSERAMTAVDASHPPTHLRVRMMAERPERDAAVIADAAEWAAIDAELAAPRQGVARALLRL
jgi:Zn-dependent protease with chaperone function